MKLYKVYQVEVGVLLDKNDAEYDCYCNVWDYKNGYYNEDCLFCITEKEAKQFIKDYIKVGVKKTYGILSEIFVSETSYNEIKNNDEEQDYDNMDYDVRNVIYSAYKNEKNEIIEDFVDINNYIEKNTTEEREV